MGWDSPWYSALLSLDRLLVGLEIRPVHLVCYSATADRVFETMDDAPGRRGNGLQPRADGSDRVRTPGGRGPPPAGHEPTITRSADVRPHGTPIPMSMWPADGLSLSGPGWPPDTLTTSAGPRVASNRITNRTPADYLDAPGNGPPNGQLR